LPTQRKLTDQEIIEKERDEATALAQALKEQLTIAVRAPQPTGSARGRREGKPPVTDSHMLFLAEPQAGQAEEAQEMMVKQQLTLGEQIERLTARADALAQENDDLKVRSLLLNSAGAWRAQCGTVRLSCLCAVCCLMRTQGASPRAYDKAEEAATVKIQAVARGKATRKSVNGSGAFEAEGSAISSSDSEDGKQ
jgi:hypothetical protein